MTNLHNPKPGHLSTTAGAVHARQSNREWTVATVEASARSRSSSPEGRLLAVFEVLDELFNRADREARSFVEVLADLSRGARGGATGDEITTSFRALIDRLAEEADVADVEGFGLSWRILSNGAILKAVGGDLESATRARRMAVDLIARHRQPAPGLVSSGASRAVAHSTPVALAGSVLLDYDVELELGFGADGRYGTDVARPTAVRHPASVSGTAFTDADYLLWELG